MAIKILKEGQKEFHAFCTWCGCEFTYEISDLKLSATDDKVDCPTCGKVYHHRSMVQDPTIPGGIGQLQIWPTETYKDPCDGCAWKEYNRLNDNYIGDTPCTWCTRHQVTNLVQEKPPINIKEYITTCTSYPVVKLKESECTCGPNATCSKCSGTSGTITATNDSVSSSVVSPKQDKTTQTTTDCICQGDVWKTIQGCCEACVEDLCKSNKSENTFEEACKHGCIMNTYRG
jgi:hypothetical protein